MGIPPFPGGEPCLHLPYSPPRRQERQDTKKTRNVTLFLLGALCVPPGAALARLFAGPKCRAEALAVNNLAVQRVCELVLAITEVLGQTAFTILGDFPDRNHSADFSSIFPHFSANFLRFPPIFLGFTRIYSVLL
jgi:hypothetical protein